MLRIVYILVINKRTLNLTYAVLSHYNVTTTATHSSAPTPRRSIPFLSGVPVVSSLPKLSVDPLLLHMLQPLDHLLRLLLLLHLAQSLLQLLRLMPLLHCIRFHVGQHPTQERKRSFEAQVPCRCARHGQVCHRKFRSQRRSIPCQRKSPQPQLNPLLGCAARNQTRGGMGVFQQQTKRTRPVVDLPWG